MGTGSVVRDRLDPAASVRTRHHNAGEFIQATKAAEDQELPRRRVLEGARLISRSVVFLSIGHAVERDAGCHYDNPRQPQLKKHFRGNHVSAKEADLWPRKVAFAETS